MATDYAECPLYKSKTYYEVVLHGTHKHMGWNCIFVGDGTMQFIHNDGTEKKFYKGREVPNWMEECWADFLAMADRHNEKIEATANGERQKGA